MFSNPLVSGAVIAAILLSVTNAAAQSIDFGVFDLRFRALNSNTHASIFGVISLLVCALAVVAAFITRRRAGGLRLLLPFTLLTILVLRVIHGSDALVLSLPFTAFALAVLWREGAGRDRDVIRAGCALLIVSFALHVTETRELSFTAMNPSSWPYQLSAIVKHDTELAGWILVAAGLLSLTFQERRRPSLMSGNPARASRRS